MSQPFSDDYDLNQQREETGVFFARKQRNNEEGNRLRIDKMCKGQKRRRYVPNQGGDSQCE